MTTEQLAAIVAAGLVNNDVYRKCVRLADYNLQRAAVFEVDLEAVSRDAFKIAEGIETAARDRDRRRRS